MTKDVALAIAMSADANDVEAAFDSAGDAALRMGEDVERATANADAATGRMSNVADSADNMGSSASQAAGGLGDLGGALALMPGPLGAVGAGMEAVAPAVMGVTGAMDLASLAMNSNAIASARARAASIAHAVAAKTTAAAQWALNAAMAANPILLVVVAVVALVAVFVLAYKKSETFRAIVQAAMRAATEAVGWVVDKVMVLVDFVRDRAPAAWDALKNKAIDTAVLIRDKVGAAFEAVMKPIQWVIDKVQALIDKIQSIPGIPGGDATGVGTLTNLPPSLTPRVAVPRPWTTTATPTIAPPVQVTIDLSGLAIAGDQQTIARYIVDAIARYFTALGIQVPGWPQLIGMSA